MTCFDSNSYILDICETEEDILIYLNDDLSDFETDKILLKILNSVASMILKNLILENSFYIPAERSEIVTDRKLLTRTIQKKF